MNNVEKHVSIFLLKWLFWFDKSQNIERRYKNVPGSAVLDAALLEWAMKWGFWIYPDWLLNGFLPAGTCREGLQILGFQF